MGLPKCAGVFFDSGMRPFTSGIAVVSGNGGSRWAGSYSVKILKDMYCK